MSDPEAGGERTYLKPIIAARIGSMSLAKIDQDLIDKTARALNPNASPATLNRQVHPPIVVGLTMPPSAALRQASGRAAEAPERAAGGSRSRKLNG